MPSIRLGRTRRCAAALLVLGSTPAVAQTTSDAPPPPQLTDVQGAMTSRTTFVAFNVWVGALSAAVRAQHRGGSVWRAALAGAAGGAVTAAGQRLVGKGPAALRFAGIQLAALGANVARNAGEGVPVLSDLILPVYPAYVRIQPSAAHPVRVRASAMALGGLAAALAQGSGHLRLDIGESMRTGAPVFRARERALGGGADSADDCLRSRCVVGLHLAGTVVYADGRDSPVAALRDETLRHETGHLAQFARDGVLFGAPASDRLLDASGAVGKWARGWLVADFTLPLLGVDLLTEAASADPDLYSLYEREVRAMMR